MADGRQQEDCLVQPLAASSGQDSGVVCLLASVLIKIFMKNKRLSWLAGSLLALLLLLDAPCLITGERKPANHAPLQPKTHKKETRRRLRNKKQNPVTRHRTGPRAGQRRPTCSSRSAGPRWCFATAPCSAPRSGRGNPLGSPRRRLPRAPGPRSPRSVAPPVPLPRGPPPPPAAAPSQRASFASAPPAATKRSRAAAPTRPGRALKHRR